MSTIPASRIVSVVPGTLAPGGSAIEIIGLMLTPSTRVPIGPPLPFASQSDVSSYFSASSVEARKAGVYFNGFDGSTVKPQSLLIAQYPTANVSAYVRGAKLSVSLTALQALNGTLSVTIDGVLKTASINLSAATSFSNAAEIIANALGIEGVQAAAFTGAIATTVLTVSAVSSGTLGIGDVINGAGVTAGTYIASFGTGSGGTGTYNLSVSQSVASEAMTAFTPAVQFDSISSAFIILSGTTGASSTITYASGALATSLLLTQAAGAVLSQGAIAAVPSTFMAGIINATTNWATLFLAWDPDGGAAGGTQKLLFSAWVNGQSNRYVYVARDSDPGAAAATPDVACMGALLAAAAYSGTNLNWSPSDQDLDAFISGAAASIDFTATAGRVDFAGLQQSGLTVGVSDDTTRANLTANGYNFYGVYGSGNAQFIEYQTGTISGPFDWLDSFINEIWFNNALQVAMLTFLQAIKRIPYNDAGYTMIAEALSNTIDQAGRFGVFDPNVPLSSSQIVDVNRAAGANVAQTLQTRGWYLLIQAASPTVRLARQSPPCTLFYVDGGSIQQINLNSIAAQ